MRFTQQVKVERKVKLDAKNKKIICCLSENAKSTYTAIAKKVGLSKDAVKYRISQLEKKGVLQGYLAIVNTAKLGFMSFHLFLQMNQLNEEIKKEIIKKIKEYDFVKVLIEFSGRYDFEIGIIAKNINELDERTTRITSDFSKYLKHHWVLILSKNYVSRTIPFCKKEKEKIVRPETKIDQVDLKILGYLSKNARMPLYEIGNKLKLTADAINYRIKKLVKSGIIVNYVPIINYSNIGYTIYAVLMNIHNLDKRKEGKLQYFLKIKKDVLWAVKTIGNYNLLMYVAVEKSDELHNLLIELREMFTADIKNYETLIAFEEYEYTYLPNCVLLNR